MEIVRLLVWVFYLYLALGCLFALLFWWRLAGGLDEAAKGISWKAKAILFPGTVLLWPGLLGKWLGRNKIHGSEKLADKKIKSQNLQVRHRQIWFLLAFFLPVFWWASVRAIREPAYQDPIRKNSSAFLPIVSMTQTSEQFSVAIRSDSSASQWQAEIRVLKPLSYPGVQAFQELDNDHMVWLGYLNTQGTYVFDLKPPPFFQISIFDIIHKNKVEEFKFF